MIGRTAIAGVAGCLAIWAMAAWPADRSAHSRLEEIVVTAERRPENLQDVALSAVVISGQSLTLQNQNTIEAFSATIPAVHVGTSGPSNDLYIRGFGSGENQSFDQSVALFIDDVYHGKSRSSGATLFDVERIELLKGPQSTFFGNNAIAGAVSVNNRLPGARFDARARALYGTHGQRSVEGAAGGPLSDRLGLRAAVIYTGLDGWLDDVATRREVPEDQSVAGRVTLTFRPSEQLEGTFKVEGGGYHQTGALHLQIANCPPGAPFAAGYFCQLAVGLAIPRYPISGLGGQEDEGPGQRIDLQSFEGVLKLDYRLGGYTFTSVSAYYDYRYTLDLDLDGTSLVLANIHAPETYHQVSQELRVASALGQPLEYLAGAYFQADRYGFDDGTNFGYLTPLISDPALLPYLPLGQNLRYRQDQRTYALFTAIDWNVTRRLKLGAGFRASAVTKEFTRVLFSGAAADNFGMPVALPTDVSAAADAALNTHPGTLTGRRTDRAWMPSTKIQYQLLPDAMVYFSYANGFKAGGFNGEDATGLPGNLRYEPEHVNAYEVGLKSTWLNHRVLLDVALFRSDYTDLQVTAFQPAAGGPSAINIAVVGNAASSLAQGAELSAQWAVREDLQLSANATWLDSHYVRYPRAGATAAQQIAGVPFQDLAGRPTQFAPRLSAAISAEHILRLPRGFRLTTRLTPYYSTSYFISYEDDPFMRQPAYVRLDAQLALEAPGGHWGLDVIGRNLTDHQVLNVATNYPSSPGSYLAAKAEPRNVAVQVRYLW